jgi:MFS family permease
MSSLKKDGVIVPAQFSEENYPPAGQAWLIWGLGALFYLSGFYMRVAPAVMTSELMADFAVGAAGLGNLSAFYYYTYVGMQLPTGVLADLWGPRKLLAAGALAAGLGTLLFAWAPNLVWAILGRGLIGGSVAVAFVALLKVAAHWFPPRRFALVSGMALFSGILGAVSAGVPLRLLIDGFGWRPIMAASGVLMLAISVACLRFIRDDPSERGFRSYSPLLSKDPGTKERFRPLSGLGRVFSFRNSWLLFWAPGGMVGPMLSFAGLWGVPFLQARYGMGTKSAAAVGSLMMICWAVGGPLMGALSDRLGRRKPLYLAGALVSALGWAVMIFWPGLPVEGFLVFAALTGLATGGMIIGFAFSKESVPSRYSGTVAGAVNMGVMIGPTFLQPAIGWVLDRMWKGQMNGEIRLYDLEAFRVGFSLMIAWSFLTCLLIALTKETYCRTFSE